MKKFLYIPVETKVRELDAKILLSMEAVKRGYVVLLGSKVMTSKLKVLPKGIFMYKDASSPMKDRFIAAKSVGHKIVVHDEEGFVWGNWEQYLNFRIKFETIRYVDTFLCWGWQQCQATIAVADMYAPQTKFSVVGHPRLDLLRKPLRNYNAPNVQNIRRILINTKLAECNHGQGPTAFIDIMMSHNIFKTDEDISKAKEQVAYKKTLMYHYIELIKTLSKKFPDTEILVRPHPSENIESWVDISQGMKNVVVTNEKPIGYWVHRSDVIIHTGCTTAIEAFLMDKPVITYKPLTDERFENELPDSISLISRSDSECVGLVNDIFDNKLKFDAYKKNGLSILRKNLDSIDGDFSFIKIMDEIDNLQPQTHLFSRVMKYKLRLLFIKSYMRSFFYNNPPTGSKIKKFSKSEVVDTLVKLNNALGRKDEVDVSKIGYNLYMLTQSVQS